tara:strand:+ start:3193 stop:3465 length:273 start_codon:yes stop_codon:yes gene_type:complete
MSSNKSIARENIRSIIKIVDTRNLSYEESEQQYENWWTGLKDKCYLINKMFNYCEDIMSVEEWNQSRIYWHKATPDETLDHIENYINKQE